MMRCPECNSESVVVEPFDFGTCPQTGYLDAGERFRCLQCGATGDASDLEVDDAA
jgi:transcription elongation factor Elf1